MQVASSVDTSIKGAFDDQAGKVTIDIDYQIIKHFSENLYSSPNKAVEELVANGYDAFAEWVQVFVPSEYTPDSLVVWDNGRSMDVEGLQTLWDIADSPKNEDDGRLVRRDGQQRKVIGKFGIGKLASYTVGEGIAHLCKTESGQFFLVGVDYTSVTEKLKAEDVAARPIYELTEQEAWEYVEQWFEEKPEGLESWFDEKSWTFAVVYPLRDEVKLTEGRLRWVMGHAMPIRPDFEVFVNEKQVVPEYSKQGANTEWEIGGGDTRDSIKKSWSEAVGDEEVAGEIRFDSETGLDPGDEEREVPYVETPSLGKVWGRFRLYDDSLDEGRTSEYGRSHGFFVMVLGRLLNGSDPKPLIGEPSYRTFRRANFVVHADGLDEVLLANRNEIKEDTPHTRELRVLLRALYRITRARQREKDAEDAEEAVSQLSRFPTNSREHFIEPLSSLIMRRGEDNGIASDFDIAEPSFKVESLGESRGVADISSDGKGLSVNSDHPYHQAIDKELGSGKKAEKARNEIERLSISERLFEGFLFDLGVESVTIDSIMQWRDQMYRMLAQKVDRDDYASLAEDLKSASYKGDSEFEEAIVGMLEAMGFIAERDGSSGKKDVKMIAPTGEDAYTLSLEAKGKSSGALANDDAEVGGAANHRDEVGAEHAVIVARKFAGMKRSRPEGPAILNECTSTGGVSIIEVDALVELARAMRDYRYSLGTPEVKKVFTEVETPDEKMSRIEGLQRPFKNFNGSC